MSGFDAIKTLQDAGLRPTRQRQELVRLLLSGRDRHVTAESLQAEAMREKIPVSLATIYNTLNQFTAAGLLREVVVEPGRSYFDTNTSDHHHFFHEPSGTLIDIPSGAIPIGSLPEVPAGTRIGRVDVIIRLKDQHA